MLQTLTFFFFISFQLTCSPPLICNILTHIISLSHSLITISLTHSQISISLTLNLTFGQIPNLSPSVQLSSPSQALLVSLFTASLGLFCLGSLWLGTFRIVREFGFFFFFFLRIKFGFVISVLGFEFVFVILKVKIKNLKSLCLFLGF